MGPVFLADRIAYCIGQFVALAEVGFHDILLHHALGVEVSGVERDGLAHDVDELARARAWPFEYPAVGLAALAGGGLRVHRCRLFGAFRCWRLDYFRLHAETLSATSSPCVAFVEFRS